MKTQAAGKVGFTQPPTADEVQYAKLIQFPYDKSWLKLENMGNHIGSMARPFIREIVTPLLINGRLPATSQPAEHAPTVSAE